MKEPDIRALLKDVLGRSTSITRVNQWLMLRCPLAQWTHAYGTDRKPSFGVHINDTGTSGFQCFACKKKGPLSYLLQLLEGFTGEDYTDLIRTLRDGELYMEELPEWDRAKERAAADTLSPIPNHYIDLYEPMDGIHPYLIERGIISLQSIAEAQLRVDPNDRGAERIVFPVYGLDGKLYGFTGRATDPTVIPKVKDYFGLPKKQLLLGLHRIGTQGYVVLVEGLLDYLVGVQYGYPALAVMHSNLTDAQASIVRELGKPVYILYDNDRAGREGSLEAARKLSGHMPVALCKYPVYDNDQPPSDPGEMWEPEWSMAIENAELV